MRQCEVSALSFWKRLIPFPVQTPRRYGILAISKLRLSWLPNTYPSLSREADIGF